MTEEHDRRRRSVTDLRNQIDSVLFDWGDTLVCPPGITTDADGHFACVESFYHEHFVAELEGTGASIDWTTFRALYEQATLDEIRRTLDTGREHSFAMRIARTMELAELAPLDERCCVRLGDALGVLIADRCVAMNGASALLRRLHGRLTLGLLSNYPHAAAVRASLNASQLLEYLSPVVISAETGWSKPHPQAFEAAVSAIGVPSERILFVGDDLDNDMRGAKRMGMHTAWLPRAGESGAPECVDVRLGALSDLEGLLGAPDSPRDSAP